MGRGTTEAIERALQLLGRHTPKSHLMFLAVLLYQALVQVLHTWWPHRFLARRSLRGALLLLGGRFLARPGCAGLKLLRDVRYSPANRLFSFER